MKKIRRTKKVESRRAKNEKKRDPWWHHCCGADPCPDAGCGRGKCVGGGADDHRLRRLRQRWEQCDLDAG